MNKRNQLAHILRSYACDLKVAGPQYASMAGVLYEAADELDPPGGGVAPDPVDDDGLPSFIARCLHCED